MSPDPVLKKSHILIFSKYKYRRPWSMRDACYCPSGVTRRSEIISVIWSKLVFIHTNKSWGKESGKETTLTLT